MYFWRDMSKLGADPSVIAVQLMLTEKHFLRMERLAINELDG